MTRTSRCYDIEDFRKAARRRLPKGLFEFIDRGAEREIAVAENKDAFGRLKLLTRFMVDFTGRDMSTELFGQRIAFPLGIAPTGIAGLCWYQGELALAKAAAAVNVPFVLTSTSITPMDTIMEQAGGRLWFQLFPWKEETDTMDLIRRAAALGYEALVVTIDWGLGRTREHNERNGFTDPVSLNRRFVIDMMRHPGWVLSVMGRYAATTGFPRHENFPERFRHRVTRPSNMKPSNSVTLSWDYLARIRALWRGPLLVKGILTAEEAVKAVEYGADGVVVSNHGGRSLDSAPATIDVLPHIVDAVGNRTSVLIDGGVRYGSDIVKALALGAKAVFMGRPTLYAVAAEGQMGAERVLRILADQFEKNMAYVGCKQVSELGPQVFAPRP